ncbi:S1 RNA-binding domain-containing protein, partial [Bdellovibrionota bacterium FG-2]
MTTKKPTAAASWENDFAAEGEQDSSTSESKKDSGDFAQMLEGSLRKSAKKLNIGDKIKSEILVVGREEVFVSTGTATDGTVPRKDLLDKEGNLPYKTGDTIELYVTGVKRDSIFLSPNPTSKNIAEDLEDAFDMELPLEGRVAEVCKGGFRVTIKGKTAFCPISQMDNTHIEKPEEYIGKKFEFRITQFSEGGRNIIISRRKLLDEERDLTQGSFLAEHKAGDVVPGKVKRIEKFGAFVEVSPGMDGLIHVSELAWSRVGDPSEVVTVGQDLRVKILKIENLDGKAKISLSLKQTLEKTDMPVQTDPWAEVAGKYPVGAIVQGKVEKRELYGLFIQLEAPTGQSKRGGITGLLHKSRITENPEFPYDKLKVGDSVT